jgi:hypothetical protein
MGLRTNKMASRKDGKDQAAERRASLCGFVRALAATFKKGLSSPSRIRTSAELSGNNGNCQVAGPFSGPIGHDLHSSEGGGTEGGIERIVRQLAALTAAERQALKAMLELLG